MSLVYVTANANSNVVQQVSQFPSQYNDKLCFTNVLDSTHNGVKDLLADKSSHLFSAIMTEQYVNAYYDNTNIVGTIVNPSATPPTTVNISISDGSNNIDTAVQVPVTNNTFSLPISVHDSVTQQKLEISINAQGCPPVYLEIGQSNGNIPVQMYKDSVGTYHLIPQNNSDLATYWQNKMVNPTWDQVDFETAIGILFDAVFNYVFPSLQNATYTPLALNAAEQSGFNDLKTNILSQVASKLDNILPDGVTPDVHYSSYRAHIANANNAMTSYVSDRTEILKYTTLK